MSKQTLITRLPITVAFAVWPLGALEADNSLQNSSPDSHITQNNGEHAFRNVTIELLRPRGKLQKYSPSLKTSLAKDPARGRTVRQAMVLQTREIRLRAVDVSPGSMWSVPHDGRDRLVIFVDKIDNPGSRQKSSRFPSGIFVWIPADHDWNVYKAGPHEMKMMVLDFLGSREKNSVGHS
jgi:hypothetical protein